MKTIWSKIVASILFSLFIISITPLAFEKYNIVQNNFDTVQAKKRQHHIPKLLDQQVAILVGLDVNPKWVQQQSSKGKLIYGVVKPSDTVPDGVKDYSFLSTDSEGEGIYLFFKTENNRVTIKYANHGNKLHTKTVTLSHLVNQLYRTKSQRQRVDSYVSSLRTE